MTLELQLWAGVFERISARDFEMFVSCTNAEALGQELFFDVARGLWPWRTECWPRDGPRDSDQQRRRPSTRGAPRWPARFRVGCSGGERAPPTRDRRTSDRPQSRRPGTPRVRRGFLAQSPPLPDSLSLPE